VAVQSEAGLPPTVSLYQQKKGEGVAQTYKVKYRKGDLEVEIESTDKEYVDKKLEELTKTSEAEMTKGSGATSVHKHGQSGRGASRIKQTVEPSANQQKIDVASLVGKIKEDDRSAGINQYIVDKPARLPRILLALFLAKEHLESPYLTTGQIESITDEMGIKVKSSNISTTIRANSKFFAADGVRRKGAIMRFKLNRQGLNAFESCLKGEEGSNGNH
jgi:hypothetical protein